MLIQPDEIAEEIYRSWNEGARVLLNIASGE
jgi:hypothetical protein